MRADPFWKRARRSGECWIWEGSVDELGYGVAIKVIDGRRIRGAHRIAWTLAKGAPPAGTLRNTCGHRNCIRPAHWIDAKATEPKTKTRGRRIREMQAAGLGVAAIAEALKVSRTTVWRHLR